jgi:hypothetical protein
MIGTFTLFQQERAAAALRIANRNEIALARGPGPPFGATNRLERV